MKYHLKEKESSKRTACGRKVEDKDGYGCVAVRESAFRRYTRIGSEHTCEPCRRTLGLGRLARKAKPARSKNDLYRKTGLKWSFLRDGMSTLTRDDAGTSCQVGILIRNPNTRLFGFTFYGGSGLPVGNILNLGNLSQAAQEH